MPLLFKNAFYGLLAVIIVLGVVYTYYNYSVQNQPPAQPKIYKIGFLVYSTKDIQGLNFVGFKSQMATLGYEEGKNISYEVKLVDKPDLPKAAEELNQAGLDMIIVGSSSAGQALKGLPDLKTKVFFLSAGRPSDLVTNFQAPEGFITGIGEPTVEFAQKRLQFLTQIVPSIKTVSTIVEKGHATAQAFKAQLIDAAKKLNLKLNVIEIPTENMEQILTVMKTITLKNTDSYIACTCPSNEKYSKELAAYFIGQKIPAFTTELEIGAIFGWLAAYSNDRLKAGMAAAVSIDKILKGAPISSVPVIFSSEVLFEINTKTAGAIGITVPQDILGRANKVFNQ